MWLTGKSKLRGDGEQIREEIKREEKATGKDEKKENQVKRGEKGNARKQGGRDE